MESILQWFQDWSDACEYAKECVPDMSFWAPREPYSALVSIAVLCFFVWWRNERRLAASRAAVRSPVRSAEAFRRDAGALEAVLGELRGAAFTQRKKAA